MGKKNKAREKRRQVSIVKINSDNVLIQGIYEKKKKAREKRRQVSIVKINSDNVLIQGIYEKKKSKRKKTTSFNSKNQLGQCTDTRHLRAKKKKAREKRRQVSIVKTNSDNVLIQGIYEKKTKAR